MIVPGKISRTINKKKNQKYIDIQHIQNLRVFNLTLIRIFKKKKGISFNKDICISNISLFQLNSEFFMEHV